MFQYVHKLFDEPPLIEPSSGFPTWEPNIEAEDDYLESVRREAIRRIEQDDLLSRGKLPARNHFVSSIIDKAKDYCEEVKGYYQSLPDWKKAETKSNLIRNLIITVLYQVGGKSLGKIAGLFLIDESNVSRSVDDILPLLDLKKREGEAGRPPGRKNTHRRERKKL